MKPEFYRSRAWHLAVLQKMGASVIQADGFGLLTFVPLPGAVVGMLLNLETKVGLPPFLKRFTVNYKMTCRVAK